MPSSDPFSLRLPSDLYKRVYEVIAATDCEVTKSELVVRALRLYFHILEAEPSMLEGYDKSKDTGSHTNSE